ncbi:ZIP family metal transporter [Candidatus Manganitrophus noduliformans]|uniref:ZIP family zinc transporter n=1 Tax=Candidatus Manganitrophus noduliformans TaxID=2606439 RepID=A0A7X6ID71_9BACT|nr:ZIP family metal transporter [Candidatus Manganitrophus noduliformans]NKE73601.1 ZIP family zinc transporter [Candidatus Manganitrophus noduliformans]
MEQYFTALAFAVLPALGNFAGGMVAEMFRISERTLSLALHGAAGIILAVVAVELMPQALRTDAPWIIILSFIAGGGLFIAIDKITHIINTRGQQAGEEAGPGMIFLGVAFDLFSDGIMIGAGSTIEFSLGLLLALGQTPADFPEGFATIAAFKAKGVARRMRILANVAFVIPLFLGTTIGYWGVRGRPEIFKLALLAFTAGMLTTVAIEEIVPQAHRGKEARLATTIFIAGFALFTWLSVYF